MSDDETFQDWIRQLAQGDSAAMEGLWKRYFDKLRRYASQRMSAAVRRVADEEDAALSAIHSFYRGFSAGRYPRISDDTDLCRLLLLITARKSLRFVTRQRASKRGGGLVRGESVFVSADADARRGIEQVLGQEPTPELAAMFTEESERRLELLDEELRRIALLKLEGYTNEEIAERLHCSVRTVERRVERIRSKWIGQKDD